MNRLLERGKRNGKPTQGYWHVEQHMWQLQFRRVWNVWTLPAHEQGSGCS